MSRSAKERGEAGSEGGRRDTTPEKPHIRAPNTVCEQIEDSQKVDFSDGLVNPRCTRNSAREDADRGDNWLGVAVGRGQGPPRPRPLDQVELLPRVYLKVYHTNELGALYQRCCEER